MSAKKLTGFSSVWGRRGNRTYIENVILFTLSGDVKRHKIISCLSSHWNRSGSVCRILLEWVALLQNQVYSLTSPAPVHPHWIWMLRKPTWVAGKASQNMLGFKNKIWWICWRIQEVPYDRIESWVEEIVRVKWGSWRDEPKDIGGTQITKGV